MPKNGKTPIKKWGFRGKKQVFRVEKMMNQSPNRKGKWCKMQVVFAKIDKRRGVLDEKSWLNAR